ncbi:MAG: hypothetical protein QXI33_02205 [Candidatus Pacearchaeota archaeon]
MERDLRGRLEKVKIISHYRNRCSIGLVDYKKDSETEVFVSDSGNYNGKSILVRFNSFIKQGKTKPLGNFISSKVPKKFNGLSPEQFILVGYWDKQWSIPDEEEFYMPFSHLNKYYEPGRIGNFIYLTNSSYNNIFRVFPDGYDIISNEICFKELVYDLLPNPYEHSRVILSESKKRIMDIKRESRKLGLKAIEMEPLRTTTFLQHQRY